MVVNETAVSQLIFKGSSKGTFKQGGEKEGFNSLRRRSYNKIHDTDVGNLIERPKTNLSEETSLQELDCNDATKFQETNLDRDLVSLVTLGYKKNWFT